MKLARRSRESGSHSNQPGCLKSERDITPGALDERLRTDREPQPIDQPDTDIRGNGFAGEVESVASLSLLPRERASSQCAFFDDRHDTMEPLLVRT